MEPQLHEQSMASATSAATAPTQHIPASMQEPPHHPSTSSLASAAQPESEEYHLSAMDTGEDGLISVGTCLVREVSADAVRIDSNDDDSTIEDLSIM